jgi:methyl-accepting chemotaxis protein
MGQKFNLETKFMSIIIAILVIFWATELFISMKRQESQLIEQVKDKARFIATQMRIERKWAAKAASERNWDLVPPIMNIETAKIANQAGLYNIRFVSSEPFNPENGPRDEFERLGLQALAKGEEEFYRIENIGDSKVLRWMTPDKASEAECLNCHPGKKVGDMLGAMTVAVPLGAVEKAIKSNFLVILGIASAIILLLGGIIHILIRFMVIKPLKQNLALAKAVASRDLTHIGPEITSANETSELGAALNTMNHNLREMISGISQSAELLASAIEQLSASTEQIARGAQESFGQTNQVATAVEQMSATILEVAKNSNQAAESAKKATETAIKGGEIVDLSIQAMNRIAEVVQESARTIKALGINSNRIGEIISVIDDIADQTNLLALNAAIEAARAGEQGRGFAVVADEVRKLAERTTKATKEIATMIKSIQSDTSGAVASMDIGTKEVENGVEMALKAGEALKEIVNMVQNVSDMISQIATASEEQSAAIEQISTSIEAIASITKESATGTQQSSKACKELNRLVIDMTRLVGQFKLPEEKPQDYGKTPSFIKMKPYERTDLGETKEGPVYKEVA